MTGTIFLSLVAIAVLAVYGLINELTDLVHSDKPPQVPPP